MVFDWDGTLADSTGADRTRACRRRAATSASRCRTTAAARYVIGLGLADALRHVAPALAAERHRDLAARYRHHYLAREAEIPLFDGVREMLDELDGRRLPARRGDRQDARRAGPGARAARHRAPFRRDALRRRGLSEAASGHAAASDGSRRRRPARNADDRRHDARPRTGAATRAWRRWRCPMARIRRPDLPSSSRWQCVAFGGGTASSGCGANG